MSEPVYLASMAMILLTLLLIFGLRYWSRIQAARAEATRDEAFKRLAAQSAATLTAIEARLAAIEKLLKTVE